MGTAEEDRQQDGRLGHDSSPAGVQRVWSSRQPGTRLRAIPDSSQKPYMGALEVQSS